MRRLQTPGPAAAGESRVHGLAVAADELVKAYEDHEAGAAASPLASACCTRALARRVRLELRAKRDAPAWYGRTAYHRRLPYEGLKAQLALLHEAPVPSAVTRLRTLAGDQETAARHLPQRSRGTTGVWRGGDEVVEVSCWATEGLLAGGLLAHLAPAATPHWGLRREGSGVSHALAPHPDGRI